MLVIRLRRTGKKKQPSYRIVVANNKTSVYGKYIDGIGHYNPFTKVIVLDTQKAMDWMNKGAKPSDTVSKIFKKENLDHKSIVIKKYRAINKKELEAQKATEEAEKAKEQAEKEAAKIAFDQQVEAEKAAQPSSEEKLHQAADESIKEAKEEETKEKEEKAPSVEENKEVNKEDKADDKDNKDSKDSK